MKLIMKDVRTFVGEQVLPVKPLTILVGENSSGKTTSLAMLAAITDVWFPSPRHIFAIPPYDLGTFSSIATKRARDKRDLLFSIGMDLSTPDNPCRVVATYVDYHGQPELAEFDASRGTTKFSLKIKKGKVVAHITFKGSEGSVERDVIGDLKFGPNFQLTLIPSVVFWLTNPIPSEGMKPHDREVFSAISEVISYAEQSRLTSNSIAPIRTKPRRTYDVINDDFKPEGDHIPAILARSFEFSEEETAVTLRKALAQFGEESGLFRSVRVRRFGRYAGGPFQILVNVAGKFINLSEVGYGVSQALPIVVESVLAKERQWLLLQQPEVHLHPKAQAALGTFFAQLVGKLGKQIVIETHSDFIIDRIRQEIAEKVIDHESVQLVFFDRRGPRTKIVPIDIDKDGNLLGAPPRYRRFFFDEEMRTLSRVG